MQKQLKCLKGVGARDLLAYAVVAPRLLPEGHWPAAGIRPASRLGTGQNLCACQPLPFIR
jgi:hypothetical protein